MAEPTTTSSKVARPRVIDSNQTMQSVPRRMEHQKTKQRCPAENKMPNQNECLPIKTVSGPTNRMMAGVRQKSTGHIKVFQRQLHTGIPLPRTATESRHARDHREHDRQGIHWFGHGCYHESFPHAKVV